MIKLMMIVIYCSSPYQNISCSAHSLEICLQKRLDVLNFIMLMVFEKCIGISFDKENGW